MFFVVSKLLAFFEEPSNVVILAGIVGLILTRTRLRAGAGGLRPPRWC